MARGGKRTPANPAPVSGPGALSRRTDGGPSQPIRVPTGGAYGQAQALETQQQAAPLAAGRANRPGMATPAGPAASPASVFAPTQRPGEPPLTGVGTPQGQAQLLPPDHNALLRAIYAQYPHPDIARLLEYSENP